MTDSPVLPIRRNTLIGVLCIVLALTLGWYFIVYNSAPAAPVEGRWRGAWEQPAPVRVVAVSEGSLDVQIQSIGTVTPLNTVNVRSRVEGVLTEVLFKEGGQVTQGDLLALIDPQPYQARFDEAEGVLLQTRARLENARVDLELYEKLHQQDSIALQQLNGQRALVAELEGSLKANQAKLEDARLQLLWTGIKAPLTGKLGLRQIDAGNLVSTGDADGLVTIAQLDPIAVMFSVPEGRVQTLQQALMSSQALQVEALDRDGQRVLAKGKLTTLDNQIDTATGTLRVKAQFDNAENTLFPNQFVNVRLHLQTLESVITIPEDAIQYGSSGAYVYVIDDSKAFVRPVSLGLSNKDRVVILDGLTQGELIVLEGLDRLRDGKEVLLPAREQA